MTKNKQPVEKASSTGSDHPQRKRRFLDGRSRPVVQSAWQIRAQTHHRPFQPLHPKKTKTVIIVTQVRGSMSGKRSIFPTRSHLCLLVRILKKRSHRIGFEHGKNHRVGAL
jgi:hypothetical protein